MVLVVAHLSDIHISEPTDLVLSRPKDIANAIVAASGSGTDCLVICTGDISFSGKQSQYDLAHDFFCTIEAELKRQGRATKFVFLPGNHDCDFSAADAVRSMLLDGIRKDPTQARAPAVQSHCLQVQTPFEAFVSKCAEEFICFAPDGDLYRSIDHSAVRLQLLNSSWMSSVHEAPGTLVFPESLIHSDLSRFTVTCLHHPPQWYTPNSRRDLWRTIAQASDVVLTGHEHEPEQVTIESRNDHSLHSHFEAPALQHKGNSPESAFSVYAIDIDGRTVQTYQFSWNDVAKRYEWEGSSANRPRPLDEPLPLNKIRSVRQFEFTDKHRRMLDALTMNITHQVVGDLKLKDLFIYPDISTVKVNGETHTTVGEEVLKLIENTAFSLITGDKYAGKSSFAKMLVADLHGRGFVPVLLRPTKKLRNTKAWVEAVERAFCEQYSESLLPQFQQLSVSTRVIIVDDADLAMTPSDGYATELLQLPQYAGRIVVFAEHVAIDPKILVRLTQAGVPHYQIRPLGYRQRSQLTQKWLLLGGDQIDAAALVRKLHDTTKNINSIVGKGFVPSYPFFVLALLHAADSAVQLESRTSAHGYYFEQLIRTELLKGKQEHAQIDVTLGVLSFIAYRFFVLDVDGLTDHDLRDVVATYEEKYDLALDYNQLVSHLCERRMLHRDREAYKFSYDYVYYFFVARYFSRNMDRADVRSAITMLCRATERRKYGDILLFLAHLSNDTFVITQMVAGAEAAFENEPPIDLKRDLSVFGGFDETVDQMIATENKIIFEDGKDALQIRDEVLRQQDQLATRHELEDSDILVINKLLAAIRNMEVVGQVLKNNPGHLDAEKKLEIARAAYGVGARIWRWFLHLIAQEQRHLAEHLVREMRGEHPEYTPQQLKQNVSDALLGLVRLGSLGMVKRIGLSIGAPELEPTYKKLVETVEGDAPKLVHMSIRLDCMPGSQESELRRVFKDVAKNPLGLWILKQLVLEHLHLFQLGPAEKQSLCAAVDIEYKSGMGTSQRHKLLPKSE